MASISSPWVAMVEAKAAMHDSRRVSEFTLAISIRQPETEASEEAGGAAAKADAKAGANGAAKGAAK